jgi:hypothetical protein
LTFASAALPGSLLAQNECVLHCINDAGQGALSLLSTGQVFVTSFKGHNDVSVIPQAGQPATNQPGYVVTHSFGGATPGNNPWYLKGFCGAASNGTGDGTVGHINLLCTAAAPTAWLAFEFAIPLTSRDQILFGDTDGNERYELHAYATNSLGYVEVSMAGWTFSRYSGDTGVQPDSRWATWNPTTQVLESLYRPLQEVNWPLVALTPDSDVHRLVIIKQQGSDWETGLQFVSPAQVLLNIERANTDAIVRWPGFFSNLTLYSSTTLLNNWSNAAATPAWRGGYWTVTNSISPPQTYYRLQGP